MLLCDCRCGQHAAGVFRCGVDQVCVSHLEYDGSIVRLAVLLEQQLESLPGHGRLPPTEHKHGGVKLTSCHVISHEQVPR